MKLVYIGKRLNAKNNVLYGYVDETAPTVDSYFFSKRLVGYETIGSKVECEPTETGVKGAKMTPDRFDNKELIEKWSVRQASAVAEKDNIKLMKEESKHSLDNLIKVVKDNTHSQSERKKVMLYIISKLS
jgi:hypothetical protein